MAAPLLASLPVAFVSGAGDRARHGGLSIYSQCQAASSLQPAAGQRAVIVKVLLERNRRKELIPRGRLGLLTARPDGTSEPPVA